MLYTSFSLNGTWVMGYDEKKYQGTENPFKVLDINEKNSGQNTISDAVPGYFEDMTDKFSGTSFSESIKINPEYTKQSYPMAETAPDMALPNPYGTFFYKREISLAKTENQTVIHFEGVQNSVRVWVNDKFIGFHEGYSTPFDILVPDDALKEGLNTIVLAVSNHDLGGYDNRLISGLTTRACNRYTGGITGDVELRTYKSDLRDASVLISEDLKTVKVNVSAVADATFNWTVSDGDKVLREGTEDKSFEFSAEGFELWSPENPKLYTLKIQDKDCSLEKVFGVRRLIAKGTKFELNGLPYYLRGICEHCYFPETLHLNHDKDYYRFIVKTVKNLGFNFIRMHTYIPEREYMEVCDELGMILHVESPNNTTVSEWKQIVDMCKQHTSVCIYCCGNELLIDDKYIEHLKECADVVHQNTDSLFSPLSALRGLEYAFHLDQRTMHEVVDEPFMHNPRKFKDVGQFTDMYSTYIGGDHSYTSTDCDYEEVDKNSVVYKKPRVSHEICIDGTYADLSLIDRYKGTRVGETDMLTSIKRHLEEKGVLDKAPLYFKNSCQWQRRVRKYCFEAVRMSDTMSGYDFLGPIDTHWHTFGYDVGMMNEFYELKPGETRENVLMYNSETVLLTDLKRKTNFLAGQQVSIGIHTSYFGKGILEKGILNVCLTAEGKVIETQSVEVANIQNGRVSKIYDFKFTMPKTEKPMALELSVTLEGKELECKNKWELYVFPEAKVTENKELIIKEEITKEELISNMNDGKTVLLLGSKPFNTLPTSFKIALAGRCAGNLATVIKDHPVVKDMPNDGFCAWQFAEMFENGNAVVFEDDSVPFNPIIEVVSTHKYVVRQAALFEFCAGNGKLMVCSFDFKDDDPASNWFKGELVSYACGQSFSPEERIDIKTLEILIDGQTKKAEGNTNFAFNPNDKADVKVN